VKRWLWILLFFLCAFFYPGDKIMTPSIQDVKKKHEARLMSLPGVVSVGIGRDPQGNPAVIVGLDSPRSETRARIPPQLDGYPLIIQIVGPLKAQ
jgi:hypothetical protein